MSTHAHTALSAAQRGGPPVADTPAADGPLVGVCGWITFVVPLVLGIWRASGSTDGSSDAAIVRDLGLFPIGSEGGVSMLLSQLFALVPLGGTVARAEWLSVVAMALATRLLYWLIQRAHAARPFGPDAVFAAIASLLLVLTPAVRLEGSALGGAAPALALVLCGVATLATPHARRDPRSWSLAAALAGLTFAEDHWAGAAACLCIVAFAQSEAGTLPAKAWGRMSWLALAGCALGLGAPALAACARGFWLSAEVLPAALAAPSAPFAFFTAWRAELGPLAAALAAAGAALLLLPRGPRRAALPLALLVLAPLACAALRATYGAAPSARSLQLLSLCGAVGLMALALQSLARWLWRARLPFAKPACALLIAFSLTLPLERLERAAGASAPALACDVWTQSALVALPARSVLLLQDSRAALRLFAERVLHGTRPDVAIVPADWLAEGHLSPALVARERELAPVLRELTLNGTVDVYALSALADVRPVRMQLDPRWSADTFDHLRPQGVWLGFEPHVLAASERRASLADSRGVLREIAGAMLPAPEDRAPRALLASALTQQVRVLSALDAAAARPLERALRELAEGGPTRPAEQPTARLSAR